MMRITSVEHDIWAKSLISEVSSATDPSPPPPTAPAIAEEPIFTINVSVNAEMMPGIASTNITGK